VPYGQKHIQVYGILDEFILAGEIQETSKVEILERIRELEKREKD
jgi:AP-2 complex subunit sigma-1